MKSLNDIGFEFKYVHRKRTNVALEGETPIVRKKTFKPVTKSEEVTYSTEVLPRENIDSTKKKYQNEVKYSVDVSSRESIYPTEKKSQTDVNIYSTMETQKDSASRSLPKRRKVERTLNGNKAKNTGVESGHVAMQQWCMDLRLGFILEELSNQRNNENAIPKENEVTTIKRGPRKAFESYVEEMVRFKEIHGHMNVSPKYNKSLCAWASNIRMSYKRLHEGRSQLIKLTPERMKSLIEIGFEFKYVARKGGMVAAEQHAVLPTLNSKELKYSSTLLTRGNDPRKKRLHSASENYLELESLNKRQKVKGSLLPMIMDSWVKSLKLGFVHESDTAQTMQDWCVDLKLGFKFEQASNEGNTTKRKYTPRKPFESYVEELKTYRENTGHINVSPKENKLLSIWIKNIKKSYKRIQEGKVPIIRLSPLRINVLEGLGFEWNSTFTQPTRNVSDAASIEKPNLLDWCRQLGLDFDWVCHSSIKNRTPAQNCNSKSVTASMKVSESPKSSPIRRTFDERLVEFKAFKEKYGYLSMQQMSQINKPLGNWCRNIKTSYGRYKKGKSNDGIRLNDERIQRLEAVGFTFSANRDIDLPVQNSSHEEIMKEQLSPKSVTLEDTQQKDTRQKKSREKERCEAFWI